MPDEDKKKTRFYMQERVQSGVMTPDGDKVPMEKLKVAVDQNDLSAKDLFTQLWADCNMRREVLRATALEHGIELGD
jgi:hypothetical protein